MSTRSVELAGVRRFVFFLLVLLPLCGCGSAPTQGPILIGHIAPFSGPEKAIGEHAKQAILLAVEEANKPENLLTGGRVAVLHVDPRGNADALQPEAVRLISVNRVVGLLGGTDATQAERLGRAAQPYDITLFTPAELPPQLLADNIFSVSPSLAAHGRILARYALEELKLSRAAVLLDGRQQVSAPLAEAFAKEFARGTVAHVDEWTFRSEPELLGLAESVKRSRAGAVLYLGMVADLAKLRGKLQALGHQVALLYGGGSVTSLLLADRETADGLYLATAGILDEASPFAKEYQVRFHETADDHAILAYDGLRILVQGLRQAKTYHGPKLRAEFLDGEKSLESLTGPLTFDKDHSARRSLFVTQIKEGRPQLVKRYELQEK